MKKLLTFLTLPFLFFNFSSDSGDCDRLIFFKEGSTTTLTNYDGNGKLMGSNTLSFKNIAKTAKGVKVTAVSQHFDKKGKATSSSEIFLRCEDGTLYFDMNTMLGEMGEAYKDFNVTIEGINKEIPSNLEVGKILNDAEIKVSVKTKDGTPMPMMDMLVKIFNRKVEAIESVTSPAGTWECYKISEDTEMKSIIKVKSKSTTWFSYDVGMVKTETYDDKGKLTGRTLLTAITK